MATKNNVFLFHGEDNYTSFQKVKIWKDQFKKKQDENDLETLDHKNFNFADFKSKLETHPFLSEKRLIIAKNFLKKHNKETQKKIAELIEKTPDFCIIVFHEEKTADKRTSLYKKLKKLAHIEEFKALTPESSQKWILDHAKQFQLNISYPTANYLSQYLPPNLWTISSEFQKLSIKYSGQEITKKIIHENLSPSPTSSIFTLTDSLSNKNPNLALKTLAILKHSGEELGRSFFMIIRHFRILIQVAALKNQNYSEKKIASKLKQHPFVIKKAYAQTRKFEMEKLTNIYNQLLEIDTKLKTGKIKTYGPDDKEFQLAIEKVILKAAQ